MLSLPRHRGAGPSGRGGPARLAPRLALGQGLYYAATGVWPLLSMRSFERVTGPKTDHWLVNTVGVLVTAIGVTLVQAGRRGRVSRDIGRLAALSAAALTAIDLVYVARRRISPVYLLDAAPEALLAAWWGAFLLREPRAPHPPQEAPASPR